MAVYITLHQMEVATHIFLQTVYPPSLPSSIYFELSYKLKELNFARLGLYYKYAIVVNREMWLFYLESVS